ncbi:MAG: SDR family NAD(P)-dependent oxidoreductase [Actinomycetota bacterium]
MDLGGKVALVTGASRGIGKHIAIALARQGCRVACAARATDAQPVKLAGTIDETVRDIESESGEAIAVPTNLALEDEVVAMVRTTEEHFGRLDVLVNNAAITFVGDLDIPQRRHDLVMDVNYRAPWLAMRTGIPGMKERGEGSILNVSSIAAVRAVPGLMVYGVSKAALERLTVDAGEQLRPDGIAVNAYRIDIPVASEGFVANAPAADHSSWERPEVCAEGAVWMLEQPASFTGHVVSMSWLRETEGIMLGGIGTT